MITFLCLLSIYQFIANVNHFENLLLNEIMWPKTWTAAKDFFLLFPKLTFILLYVSKYKSILLRVYSNLLFYKDFSGNTISEIKICLNIDDVFKLFEIVLANFHDKFHKKLKRRCYIFIFFCLFVCFLLLFFWRKGPWRNVCIGPLYHIYQYFEIHAKQIKRIAAFLKSYCVNFYPFLFLNKILISNQWKVIRFWGLQQIED